ncbi:neurofilament heavy polypeptide-like [Pogonomyrmex barbatus]|uniref:Neurofilament heavy polypeptide-like n=1 Tax=Pogonomyrmex barbatus TaxID=144034 RepID=A0A6I9W0Z3_9HYME|nr:neurofilament heavy polypeptide-like [Pogonomyrmex barbatus]
MFFLHNVIIDCSRQNESVKNATVDVRLEFETKENVPMNTTAYCLIVHDRMVQYNPLTNVNRRYAKNRLCVEESPVREESPVCDESPVREKSPVRQESPVREKSPVREESVCEESPVREKSPVREELPDVLDSNEMPIIFPDENNGDDTEDEEEEENYPEAEVPADNFEDTDEVPLPIRKGGISEYENIEDIEEKDVLTDEDEIIEES